MRNKKNIIVWALATLLSSCAHDENHSSKATSDTLQVKTPSIPFFDSIITLKDLPILGNERSTLFDTTMAVRIFKDHFKKEGYLVNGEDPKSKSDYEKLQVLYDTMYKIENKSIKAIVSYWITPYGASGHCYQPHHAVIVNSKNGYSIIKEDFIPDYFYIDSVKDGVQQAYIYGCDFDCSDNKRLRNFKITLK